MTDVFQKLNGYGFDGKNGFETNASYTQNIWDTLTLAYLADYALIMRGSLIDEIGSDYLTTARAKPQCQGVGAGHVAGLADEGERLRPVVRAIAVAVDFGDVLALWVQERQRHRQRDHWREHTDHPDGR